uniref:Uncharacterized protein n=1 Tax=Anguilla anguilla TaxID=7936 RepID=A0A0E9Q8W1_ANGAN
MSCCGTRYSILHHLGLCPFSG